MDTAIRKATRLEYQPPKRKHLDTLVAFTHQHTANTADIMHMLTKRMGESSWIIVFKVLIIIHTLIREGPEDVVISYVYRHPEVLDTSKLQDKSSTHAQVQNIGIYREYLVRRAETYGQIKVDLAKAPTGQQKEGRLRHLPVAKGLLRETQVLQKQIDSILRTDLHIDGVDRSICVHVYRLIVEDLLACFKSLNEGVVNILEHYFEMSKIDAKTSLDIYKQFAKETDKTVNYLNQAKRIQSDMQMSIPNVKHAPLTLVDALEEYLNDPSYESQREELASKTNGSSNHQQASHKPPPPDLITSNLFYAQHHQQQQTQQTPFTIPIVETQPQQQQQQQPPTDFFGSIANEQATIFHTNGGGISFLPQQPTNTVIISSPIQTLTTTNTGSTSNPFRMSTLPPQMTDGGILYQHTGSPFQQPQQPIHRSASMMLPRINTGAPIASNPFRTLQHPQITGQIGGSLLQQQQQPTFTPNTGNQYQAFMVSSPPSIQQSHPTGTNPFMMTSNSNNTTTTTAWTNSSAC